MQIVFESRLGAHNVLNGTDFRIPQKGIATKGNAFASHKYAGKSTLRYKLGVNILAGNLVWIQGPYLVSKYTDITILTKFCVTSLSRIGAKELSYIGVFS